VQRLTPAQASAARRSPGRDLIGFRPSRQGSSLDAAIASALQKLKIGAASRQLDIPSTSFSQVLVVVARPSVSSQALSVFKTRLKL
jgi:hypothetical protein